MSREEHTTLQREIKKGGLRSVFSRRRYNNNDFRENRRYVQSTRSNYADETLRVFDF